MAEGHIMHADRLVVGYPCFNWKKLFVIFELRLFSIILNDGKS